MGETHDDLGVGNVRNAGGIRVTPAPIEGRLIAPQAEREAA
jgi:hypothetical protein